MPEGSDYGYAVSKVYYDCYNKWTSTADFSESPVDQISMILHCLKTNHSIYTKVKLGKLCCTVVNLCCP